MNNDSRDHTPSDPGTPRDSGPDQDGFGTTGPASAPRAISLAGIEEDDDYEEPDRDTDYASFYGDEEDEEDEDVFEDEEDAGAAGETDTIWSFDEDSENDEDYPDDILDDTLDEIESRPAPVVPVSPPDWAEPAPDADDVRDWEEGDYEEEDDGPEAQQWPLGMILVGVVALLLLTAGGYGVLQQRSAMQEEIRQLQATLAVSVSPGEVAASREAVAVVEQRNAELQANVDSLVVENKRLADTVAGLEAQLQSQREEIARQEALAKEALAKKAAATPAPARKAPPPAKKPSPAAAATAGGWFVNFGSYARRDTAESWAGRLKPAAGEVVVTTGTRDGKTLYRVRVVGLAGRDQAESVARKLEADHDLPKLWVGQQ